MNILIVDDEALARERLLGLLDQCGPGIQVVGSVASVKAALEVLQGPAGGEPGADVILLDIQMPVLDGFDLVSMLPEPRPYIIFVTAYDEFALRAFEVNALDYLTKPVRLERLKKTLERARERRALEQNRAGVTDVLRELGGNYLKRITGERANTRKVIDTADIRWIASEEGLIYGYGTLEKVRLNFTLDELEHRLDPGQFVRIHRTIIVNITFVVELFSWFAGTWKVKLKTGEELPVARRRVKELKRMLGM